MNLPMNIIIPVACVFGAGFLLMIPFAIAQSKRKKKEQSFATANNNMAVLHLYAEAPVIDGTGIKQIDHVRGENLDYIVALLPGKHRIEAKYATTSVGAGKNINYKTPQPIASEIELQGGHTYSMAIYLYSPEQRYAYYKGDVDETVYSQTLDITGTGSYNQAYIICYKEK